MANSSNARWFLATCLGALGAVGFVPAPLHAALPARPATAQDAKAELEKKLAAIDRKDAEALFGVAMWAEQNNLKTDSKRLLREVIKVNPDHAQARELLGYEKFDGKWLTKREIEREKAKAEEAEKAAKGLKKWKDQWVPADEYEKLEKGLVKYEADGEVKWVTPEQKERLVKGMVLYDGLWMTKEDVEHRRAGEFKIGDKWLKEDEANKVHADFSNPWVLESDYCELTTTCSYEFARKAMISGDKAIERAYQIIGLPLPAPADFQKVKVIMVKDIADYSQLGNQVQDATDASMSSVWSTFILTDATTGRFGGVTIYEVLQQGNDSGNDNFSLGHVRFAAAAAAVRNIELADAPSPWFSFGIASYVERYWVAGSEKDNQAWAKWTLSTLMKEGGLIDLKNFFDPFTTSRQSILQAGAVIGYLAYGQNKPKKLEELWQKVRESFKKPKEKGLTKDFIKLETELGKSGQKEFDAYIAALQG